MAAVTYVSGSFMTFVDEMDTLLHYVPVFRKAIVLAADDPQEAEDEHVKQLKKRHDDGR
jgi:hypothetical protein